MATGLFRKYATELFISYSAEEFVNDTIFQRKCKRKEAFQNISLLKKELPETKNDLAYRIICGLHTTGFKQSDDIKQAGWNRIMQKNRSQRSFPRQIRVASKKEMEERIYLGIEEINREPVVFRWSYKVEACVSIAKILNEVEDINQKILAT